MEHVTAQNPPATLRIAAALFLAHGTFILVRMVAGFLAQHGTFDIAILSLPLGFSLLRGSVIARICMLVIGALGFSVHSYLLVLIFTQGYLDRFLPEERTAIIVTVIFGISAISLALGLPDRSKLPRLVPKRPLPHPGCSVGYCSHLDCGNLLPPS